jgi:hypothetical protein
LLPIMTAYALSLGCQRPLKRLYDRRDELMEALLVAYKANNPVESTL